jgi:hypothetical protein
VFSPCLWLGLGTCFRNNPFGKLSAALANELSSSDTPLH